MAETMAENTAETKGKLEKITRFKESLSEKLATVTNYFMEVLKDARAANGSKVVQALIRLLLKVMDDNVQLAEQHEQIAKGGK